MLYLSGLAVWALRRHRFNDANMPTKKLARDGRDRTA